MFSKLSEHLKTSSVASGHRRDCHLFEFIAEMRPMKFRFLEAVGRYRVLGAHCCHWQKTEAAIR